MSTKEDEKSADELSATEKPLQFFRKDPLADTRALLSREVPAGVDRRHFLIRSAVGGAAAVMTGCTVSDAERTSKAAATVPRPGCAIGAAARGGPQRREEGRRGRS